MIKHGHVIFVCPYQSSKFSFTNIKSSLIRIESNEEISVPQHLRPRFDSNWVNKFSLSVTSAATKGFDCGFDRRWDK